MQKRTILLSSLIAFAVAGLISCGGKSIKNGTYTSSVQGMNDAIEVSVTIANKKIADVQVTKNSETPGIGSPLMDANGTVLTAGGMAPTELIPAEIVKHQSVNVDVVTGATITSAAVKAAVSDCLKQAKANPADWNAKPEAASAPENASADVVVVGGGGAGLAAAIAAGQQNKSVIIVEKNGEVGGDTLVCGAIYNTPDEALQKKVTMGDAVKRTIEAALAEAPKSGEHAALQAQVRSQWNAYKASGRTDLFDSKEWYALQTWNGGDKVANLNLVKKMCYNAYDGLNWIDDLGMSFSDVISQAAGSLWERSHTSTMKMGTGFLSTYVNSIAKLDNVTIMVETTGKSLVKDGDRVTGVVCVDRNGNEFTLSAKVGVILATGGFGANSQMVQRYNTTGKWPDLSQTGTTNRFSCSQGDGIIMATNAGAGLRDMEQIQLLYIGNLKDGQLTKYPPRDVNGTDQIIFINKEGKRFTNEGGRRDNICLAVFAQPDKVFYMLESGDGDKYKDIKDPEWRSADGFTFDYLESNGYIYKGDTLEELAGKLGMNVATLQATIDTFNASVESGRDEFGRTLYSTKLTKGPWVATPRQACIHHTMGGVTIDTNCHVIGTNGKVIPGLYAAGEITGGIHGANRLGGNAVTDTVVFGKLAGDTVVADAR
ncbi:FAD-dependent oxidoreductase [Treponema socranskii]|uniref:FAD-dependent oxidoreductase n=1 Tax=Treponema socranskii TaxID=53419 RepID=UPI002871913D|nr:FAD-dependent oxidoreductase [Treponema socranskii]MDR9858450.1 FAD-dependent oxidoreductase [Treponema socranskii]